MSTLENPDFSNDKFLPISEDMLAVCEKLYEEELSKRQLTWETGNYNQKTEEYSIVFGTNEGIYLTSIGKTVQKCFEAVIKDYDQAMLNKSVPLNPLPSSLSNPTEVTRDPQIDETTHPLFRYNKVKLKLSEDTSSVTIAEATFFLDYFKEHTSEGDFELAIAAQKILENKNPS